MDLKSNHASPVLADPVPIKQSRLSLYSNMFPFASSRAAFSPDLLLIPRKKTGIRDDVLSSGWLDAMKASSPPPKRIAKDVNDEFPSSDSDLLYSLHSVALHLAFCQSEPFTNQYSRTRSCHPSSNMVQSKIIFTMRNSNHAPLLTTVQLEVKYPSALASFEQIVAHAKGKRIALFLDYDGTLSPIVDNPDCAFMSNTMRAAVKEVAKFFPTAIISGRSRDKVYEFVGLPELHYAGSHGMDIMGPDRRSKSRKHRYNRGRPNDQEKEVKLFQPAREFLPMIDEVFKSLGECTKAIDGAKVENNKFCVSVHYRNVDEKNWDVIAQCVHDVLKDYPQLRLTHGRKVLEVRPVISWDKGKAVTFLLESLGLDNCDDVLPIYVGDDRTDEDAFKVLRDGNCGYGILVSSMPKESNAFYSLRDPCEVMEFLKSLAMWKKAGSL